MSAASEVSQPTIAQLIDLSGKTAIVTGASMGIGRGIAERLHEAGAAVVIADTDEEVAQAVSHKLDTKRPDSALALHTDVSEPLDIDEMVAATVANFGGVDILVNNAGIYPFSPFLETNSDLFNRVLRVNLLGVFLGMQAAARQMIKQGRGGKIINVTSIDALHPSMIGLAHYDASKHGVWGLTKNVALELAEHDIAVNALAPGAVMTPGVGAMDQHALQQIQERIPEHRMARPDDMARVALFLASDLSSYLTGSQVVADGGLLLR